MTDKLFIPKTISVGYQERGGTYTGKLAYIIYTDNKGVLRKETSWQGWRDKKIDPNVFDNVPTEGFVLNKGVGGARESYGWNPRNEYIRVYDPRGFEFEISVANLLFILQECTSTKGKGLEGEFIYSWQGKDLVLLPANSKEYKESILFTAVQSNKVSARDLKVGCTYQSKRMEEFIYMGRFMWYVVGRSENYSLSGKKQHIFYNIKTKQFTPKSSMTFLSNIISDIPVDNYADLMDDFNGTKYSSLPKSFKPKNKKPKFDDRDYYWSRVEGFLKLSDNRYVKVSLKQKDKNDAMFCVDSKTEFSIIDNNLKIGIALGLPQLKDLDGEWDNDIYNKRVYYKKTDLEKLDWLKLKIENQNGGLVDAESYTNYYRY